MHGLSHVAGIGPRVTVNGKSYQVRGKTNRFYAELEAELLKLRGDPFDMIVEAAKRGNIDNDPTLVRKVAEVVVTQFRNWRTMTYKDYAIFMDSATGDALTVYHCLKQDAPELTFEDVKHVITEMRFSNSDAAREELNALFTAIEQASGENPLGNSNGRTPQVEIPALTGS